MVFGKKKTESATDRKKRLEAELQETAKELEKEMAPPMPPPPPPPETRVHEMKNAKNGDAEAYQSFLDSTMARYEASFPELGPSGHAHVVRTLLVAILAELKELRGALKR